MNTFLFLAVLDNARTIAREKIMEKLRHVSVARISADLDLF